MATQINNIGDSSTKKLREDLLSRNIYSLNNEYPLTNNTRQQVVNSISGLINVVAPFRAYDLRNTIYGRLASLPNTPLVDIGLIMLGKQFAMTISSKFARDNFPTIRPLNILKKGQKVFTSNVNYEITKKTDSQWFTRFLNSAYGSYNDGLNPFTKLQRGTFRTNTDDLLNNTGTGQLSELMSYLNSNIYKTTNDKFVTKAREIDVELTTNNQLVVDTSKIFFSFSDSTFNPFFYFRRGNLSNINEDGINSQMRFNYYNFDRLVSYGDNIDFINDYLGRTKSERSISFENDANSWVGLDSGFNKEPRMIWGWDGVDADTNNRISRLRGIVGGGGIQPNANHRTRFGVRTGLLEHTRNLINATGGRVGDITKKAFTDDRNNILGFNGSPLWRNPRTGEIGQRQHTVLDKYDRLTKAIRFNGNTILNSVNEDSVIPKMSPVRKEDGEIDIENLMFSIENLAVRTLKDDKHGIIDDEEGSYIPLSEVGPFGGRFMWFMPYAIEYFETTSSRYESTVMMGRNEPIYNYQNSERSATLRFMLIIDHPPNVKGMTTHREIAEFFAFGGDWVDVPTTPTPRLEDDLEDVEDEIKQIQPKQPEEPDITPPESIVVVFPNDVPNVAQVNTVFDTIYTGDTYEIDSSIISSDGASFGLNRKIFKPVGIEAITPTPANTQYINTIDTAQIPPGFSQYTVTGETIQLNRSLLDLFSDEVNRQLYKIRIVGSASRLFRGSEAEEIEYNRDLSERRVNATKRLIEQRILSVFGSTAENLGIEIETDFVGSAGGSDAGAKAENIPLKNVKNERASIILFERNNVPISNLEVELTPEEQERLNILLDELDVINSELNKRTEIEGRLYNQRGLLSENSDNAILDGFESITTNTLYPAFYSQTPEEYHRRLTFLQQCMRQGAALRYDVEIDDNGIERVRNSVFGRQPICIIRIGDFIYSKVIIENLNIDYNETTWDLNPEGFGVQPMSAEVTLQIKIIGGQSLKGPIDALQNAVAYNYYANSTASRRGLYKKPYTEAQKQREFIDDVVSRERERLMERRNRNGNNE